MKKTLLLSVVGLLFAPTLHAATLLSSSSRFWNVVGESGDPADDRLVASRAVDLVGSPSDPGFLTRYLLAEASVQLAMRVRLDGTNKQESFSRVLLVGLDADLDGAVDVFLAVNQQGAKSFIGIYGTGETSNDTPGSTTLSKKPYYKSELTVFNYDYRPVDLGTDGGTTDDLGINQRDYYLSFAVPFDEILGFLGSKKMEVNEDTSFQMMAATTTHATSLNIDIFGVDGDAPCDRSWKKLGAFGAVESLHTAKLASAVPEPSAAWVCAAALVGWARRRSGPVDRP